MLFDRKLVVLGCLFIFLDCTQANYKVLLEANTRNGAFEKIGEVHFSNLKGDGVRVVNQTPLSRHTLIQMKGSADEENYFKIRVSTQLQDTTTRDDIDESWITSFSSLDDILERNSLGEIHLESDGFGNLISINLVQSQNWSNSEDENLRFASHVEARQPMQAVMPDTNGYLSKMDKERKIRDNPNKDNRSFIAKYWMYIVPVCFFVVMQNAAGGQQ